MTRKEKTAKLLYDWLTTLIDSTITESWEEEYKMSPSFRAYVDAIISIPLNIPTDEEIAKKIQLFRKNKLDGYGNMSIGRLQLGELEWSNLVLDISKWMRDEILKRNK